MSESERPPLVCCRRWSAPRTDDDVADRIGAFGYDVGHVCMLRYGHDLDCRCSCGADR
jgi:hypothetical protein